MTIFVLQFYHQEHSFKEMFLGRPTCGFPKRFLDDLVLTVDYLNKIESNTSDMHQIKQNLLFQFAFQ